jgi:hypothetical protein
MKFVLVTFQIKFTLIFPLNIFDEFEKIEEKKFITADNCERDTSN